MKVAESPLQSLAEPIAALQFERMPELQDRYGSIGKLRCIEDNQFHLSFLAEAASLDAPSIFMHYVEWARTMLESRGVAAADLKTNLETMKIVIASSELELSDPATRVLDEALAQFDRPVADPSTFLDDALPDAHVYLDHLLEGRHRDARVLITELADGGTELQEIYLRLFEPVQREVGRLWQLNRINVAQEHFCTAATQSAMAQLYPRFLSGAPGARRMIATCAGPELHEIGLRMITDLLEIDGWDTSYLGANIPIESIVAMLRQHPPELLAISATIAGNLGSAASLIRRIRSEPQLENLPIIVGGYPFRISQELTAKIGADATAASASEAVLIASTISRR